MVKTTAPQRRASRISVPDRAHPHAKLVFRLMNEQAVTYDEMEWRANVLRSTLKAWRTSNSPGLETLSACLGVLGWYYLPVPSEDKLPPAIREGLIALAADYADREPLIAQLMRHVAMAPVIAAAEPNTVVIKMPARKKRTRQPHPDQAPLFAEEEAA